MINRVFDWIRVRYRIVKLFLYRLRTENDFRDECKNNIAKWINANGIAACVSFLIACLIYFSIREMIDNVFETSFPVEIQAKEDDEPLAVIPSTVLITLRGAYKDYTPINPSLRKVVISRPGPEAFDADGVASVKIRNSSVKGVSGLTIQKISPGKVEVLRDKNAEFEFELAEPKSIGDPLHGHAELSFVATNIVTVRGGATRLEQLKQLGYKFELDPVDVSGLGDYSSHAYVAYRKARVLSPSVDLKLKFIPEEVPVKIVINKEGKDRRFPNMPVKIALPSSVPLPDGCAVSPSYVSVTLKGWTNIMDKVSAENVAVYADVTESMLKIPDSGAVTNPVPLRVLAPTDISIWSAKTDPEVVSLIVKAPPKIEPVTLVPQENTSEEKTASESSLTASPEETIPDGILINADSSDSADNKPQAPVGEKDGGSNSVESGTHSLKSDGVTEAK